MRKMKTLTIKPADLENFEMAVYGFLNSGDLNFILNDTKKCEILKVWNKYIKPVVNYTSNYKLDIAQLTYVNERLKYIVKCLENSKPIKYIG